jgi:ubiquinone/menaquinone biosynthesis C-methylase UbiE
MSKDNVREHFEGIAGEYDRWKEKSAYYYRLLAAIYREQIPEGASVLEIGCGTGTLLHTVRPSRGLGVDVSPKMVGIAAAKFPTLTFRVADAERFDPGETFDFVIVPDVVEHLSDAGAMFRSARKGCHSGTRVIVTSVNPLWAPALDLAEKVGLKMPEGNSCTRTGAQPGGGAVRLPAPYLPYTGSRIHTGLTAFISSAGGLEESAVATSSG